MLCGTGVVSRLYECGQFPSIIRSHWSGVSLSFSSSGWRDLGLIGALGFPVGVMSVGSVRSIHEWCQLSSGCASEVVARVACYYAWEGLGMRHASCGLRCPHSSRVALFGGIGFGAVWVDVGMVRGESAPVVLTRSRGVAVRCAVRSVQIRTLPGRSDECHRRVVTAGFEKDGVAGIVVGWRYGKAKYNNDDHSHWLSRVPVRHNLIVTSLLSTSVRVLSDGRGGCGARSRRCRFKCVIRCGRLHGHCPDITTVLSAHRGAPLERA